MQANISVLGRIETNAWKEFGYVNFNVQKMVEVMTKDGRTTIDIS
jgi:hypothetical protein